MTILGGFPNAFPTGCRLRGTPAELSDRRSSKWDAFEGCDTVSSLPLHLAEICRNDLSTGQHAKRDADGTEGGINRQPGIESVRGGERVSDWHRCGPRTS